MMRLRLLVIATVATVALLLPALAGAATITVNTLLDRALPGDGLCSLREAIVAGNTGAPSGGAAGECVAGDAAPTRDDIVFSVAGLIRPRAALGPLPAIVGGSTRLDGWSAPGGAVVPTPVVRLDGVLLGAVDDGLTVDSDEVEIRGLQIGGFYNGIRVEGASSGTWIYGNHIGVNAAGTAADANNVGVSVADLATATLVGTNGDGVADVSERNVLSGNDEAGIALSNDAELTTIAGNRIGTNRAGTAAIPNQWGVTSVMSVSGTTVGVNGDGSAGEAFEGNLISGNSFEGIRLTSADSTVIAGNRIGTNAAGTAGIGNGMGVYEMGGVAYTRIGTDGNGVSDVLERNIVSGNVGDGIRLEGLWTAVAGNWIGTTISGLAGLPNGAGIHVGNAVAGFPSLGVVIGGPGARFRNVISGHTLGLGWGIGIEAEDVTVQCNYIGSDRTGLAPLGNRRGITLNVSVGVVVDGNVLLANTGYGLVVDDTVAQITNNAFEGNGVGLEYSGAATLSVPGNWWNSTTGPTSAANPGGTGDIVSTTQPGGVVTFAPWATARPSSCP